MKSAVKAVVVALVILLVTTSLTVLADGTYSDLGTSDSADGSNDAINFSQGRVWTVDSYGKYIWLTQNRTGPTSHWAWSNDEGANWSQGAENYTFLTRASVAYDSNNDKLHVIWAATDSNDGVIYRRYGITRDGSNNITAIAREDSGNINLQLDTTSSRTLEQPVALWVDDGSANGILVAVWAKSGSGLAEVRASMRKLSLSAADGVAANWDSLDGTPDTFGTDPPAVDADKIYTAGSGAVAASADLRGGAGSFKDDLYVFVAPSTGGSDSIIAYRASWDGVDLDWSGGWQSPITMGAMDTSSGYNLKYQLITQPAYDSTNDRLYIGWARWKSGGDGDTVSMAYLNSANSPSSVIDIYAANGTHSYAPTLDLTYDSVQDYIYASYVLSTTNGDNGSIEYKTYDGTTLSAATTFYTSPGGVAGANGSADIPITYKNRYDDKLLYAFRINGALPPTGVDPHSIYWGYVSLPTLPQIQFTSTSSSGAESVTSVNIPVSISGTFSRDIDVEYDVTGGSASGSGVDYTLASGTLSIASGDTTNNIVLSVVSDSSDETDETVIVTLSSPVFATLGSNTSFTYTITDDDITPTPTPTPTPSSGQNKKAKSSNSCTSIRPKYAPEILSAKALSATSVKLDFKNKNSELDSFTVEYGGAKGSSTRKSHINSKNATTYTLFGLAPNTTYSFKIRANNLCKSSAWSEVFKVKTPYLGTFTTTPNQISANSAVETNSKIVELAKPIVTPKQEKSNTKSFQSGVIIPEKPAKLTLWQKISSYISSIFR